MKKKILVAPLNWGIGHATRCIPIINWLIEYGFEPIIASDSDALSLLKKEFTNLTFITLPSLNIEYQKQGHNLKIKLLKQLPFIFKTLKTERKITKQIIREYDIDGIISDCRFGIYSKTIPSVLITHQLNVLSGSTTFISSALNKFHIKKYKEIWVPDFKGKINLSGRLAHLSRSNLKNIKYIGPLSRLKKTEAKIQYDIIVVLSGPEPQRSLLESKLVKELMYFKGSILFVKGIIELKQVKHINGNSTVYNFMTSQQLEEAINSSKSIICRSGYTSIMDLATLEKKAFFIPTPGQFEQEYLAKRLDDLKLVPHCNQQEFTLSQLEKLKDYKGLNTDEKNINLTELFSLFDGE